MEGGVGGKPGFGSKPKALVCHICGREFGTKSLAIHIKACAKKWEEQEALKPPGQRRPVPQAPQLAPDVPIGATRADLDRRNEAALAAFEEQAMVQCANCGRTFLEDRLAVHHRSCTADNPARAVQGKAHAGAEEAKAKLSVTYGGKKGGAAEEMKAAATASPSQLQKAMAQPNAKRNSPSPDRGAPPQGSPMKPGAKPAVARPEQPGTAKFCPQCGSKYADAAKFCAECGAKRP